MPGPCVEAETGSTGLIKLSEARKDSLVLVYLDDDNGSGAGGSNITNASTILSVLRM